MAEKDMEREEQTRKFDKQQTAIENFFSKSPFGEGTRYSWGLLLIIGFGIFALFEIIKVIFFFFN